MPILGSPRLDALIEGALDSPLGQRAVDSPTVRRSLSRARTAYISIEGALGRCTPRHRRAAQSNPSNPTLGIAMMVQNMASTVGHALCPELLALVDDVVALDSGSTDGTQDILRAAGARVIHAPWPQGGFGEQQTRSVQESRADWVLVLDADEVPTVGLLDALPDLLRQHSRVGWWLPRMWLVPWSRDVRWICEPPHWPDYQPRLARRSDSLRWVGPVHQTIPRDVRGGWGRAPEALAHLDLIVTSRATREEKVHRRSHMPHQRGTEVFYLWEERAVRTSPVPPTEVPVLRAARAARGEPPGRPASMGL